MTGRTPRSTVQLAVPTGSVVVVAGLPGAGKTTLLRRWSSTPGTVAFDSEDVAHHLALLRVPYRLLRPIVHLVSLLRVALALRSPAACVLTTDPMTSPLRRALVRLAARAARRRLVIVLVDVTPVQARDGQRRRGRVLGRRRMRRHETRYRRAFAGRPTSGVDLVLTREEATRAKLTVAEGSAPCGPRGADVTLAA